MLAIIALVSTFIVAPVAAKPDLVPGLPVYLSLGDSWAWGQGPDDPATEGYVPQLQGELKVEGLTYDVGDPAVRKQYAMLNETLSRFELSTGEVGYGMHENLVTGVYHPHGFDEPGSVAK